MAEHKSRARIWKSVRLPIEIEFTFGIPMHRQISDALRQAIMTGVLEPGSRLPSVRGLAEHLEVSHSIVARAFEDLASQGYIETAPGSGTRVCLHQPGDVSAYQSSDRSVEVITRVPELSHYGKRLLEFPEERQTAMSNLLNYGGPPLELTPISQWKTLFSRHCRAKDAAFLQYSEAPLGYPPLREAYAAYLIRGRAVRCTADQVIIFSARELRLDLLLRLLLNPGDNIAVENPGYPGARSRFAVHGATIIPVPVDAQGMDVDYLSGLDVPIKFVYVTPSHHEPTGAVMPMKRRKKLLEWAKRKSVLIIEDDYDSEYRYLSRPIPSLQGLDDGDCVIHLSCLWKVLSPLVKIGFLVVPKRLVRPVTAAKNLTERDLPLIDQFALTDFINEGYLEKAIRKNRKVYASRRDALVSALKRHFGNDVIVSTESAGMDVLIRFKSEIPDELITILLSRCGLDAFSSQPYYVGEGRKGEFILPFSFLDESTIEARIAQASAFLKSGINLDLDRSSV